MQKESVYPTVRKKGLTLFFSLDQCVVVGTEDPTTALQIVINNLELAFLDDLLDGVSNETDPRGELVYGDLDRDHIARFAQWCSDMLNQAESGKAVLHMHGGTSPEASFQFLDHYKAQPTVIFY